MTEDVSGAVDIHKIIQYLLSIRHIIQCLRDIIHHNLFCDNNAILNQPNTSAPKLLFTGSVMIVFLGFYYFPDTIPGIVLQPPKKGAFSTKKYWYLYK